ncbi:sigma-70 family RNA polymerase sigma factor [Streptomyces sp. NBC_00243]|uniref:RNA polymerase sigma factor n=1 Tax=Streptomyces sp. NBC_00243 TaxID=2975688 RepID=UPI002DDA83CE|nr:sigma-70 family RNA polymerase sigma factor [Streptomyces sp. NBC_00243]WRZ21333.1 sigma-70 family RNA polymerase sigma factor [Streptomyces sp. NBC_00243]
MSASNDVASGRESDVRGRGKHVSHTEFEAFFKAEFTRIMRMLITIGASSGDAADATQEAMIELLSHWEEVREPRAWARKVAIRTFLRSQTRAEPLDSEASAWDRRDPIGMTAPVESHLTVEAHEVLNALRQLPPRQRQVMAWTIDGFRPAEIAHHLLMTEATVRSSLRHARSSLKRLLLDTRLDEGVGPSNSTAHESR